MRDDSEADVEKFLASDRQWLRAHRLQHAQWNFQSATTDEQRTFWHEVLERLKD